MAHYAAIRAVGESVLALMREACPVTDLQLGATPRFELALPGSLTEGQAAPAEGFHLILWRVGIGSSPRNLPPRRAVDGQLDKPSLPLDLYFLLLPIAATADKQTQMLGWALAFLHQMPALSGEVINRHTTGSAAIFRADETVELIADPLGTADYLALWDRVKGSPHVGMTYVARMVRLDIDPPEPTDAPAVEQRFGVGTPGGLA